MAVGIALLLCLAQAFASPPAIQPLPKEAANPPKDRDMSIVVRCYSVQKSKLASLAERLPKLAAEVLEEVDEDVQESAQKYFRQLEEPVTKIAAATTELHRNVTDRLRAGQLLEAAAAFQDGINAIRETFAHVRALSDKAVEENAELSVAADLWLWKAEREIANSKTDVRKNLGNCLADGRPHLFE